MRVWHLEELLSLGGRLWSLYLEIKLWELANRILVLGF